MSSAASPRGNQSYPEKRSALRGSRAAAGVEPPTSRLTYRPFINAEHYNIREPSGERFPVKEFFEEGSENLPFNTRLRINASTHPHHKTPRLGHAGRDQNMMALRANQSRKFIAMLDFIIQNQNYYIRRVKEAIEEKYRDRPEIVGMSAAYARQLLKRYFSYLEQKPDEYHISLFTNMGTKEGIRSFSDAIVAEIIEFPIQTDFESEEPRYRPIPGEIWKRNQIERGTWGEPLNVRMAARGKTMKQLAKKAKIYRRVTANKEISQNNADFIERNLGLNLNDVDIIAKLKPTEEEEAELRSIATQEGGKRKRRVTLKRKTLRRKA